mgnify:CR=1 FL=1
MFFEFEFVCGTPPSCLKVMVGGGWWWVAYSILVSAQGPLVFGFGFGGLRVWGQGLTIFVYNGQAQVKVWSGPAQKLIALDLG